MAKQRFKKFGRSKTLPEFRITEIDQKILQDLADYRFLDTSHILALNSEVPKRTIQYRLQQLYHAGFLERPVHQFSRYEPPTDIIYTLGKKGAEFLFPGARAVKQSRELKSLFLKHNLLVSDFRVILTLALRKKENQN